MITATAYVASSSIGPEPVTLVLSYVVGFSGAAFDGTTATGFGGAAYLPLTANSKHADKLLRVAIAAQVFSSLGLVIDPDDIYVPFN